MEMLSSPLGKFLIATALLVIALSVRHWLGHLVVRAIERLRGPERARVQGVDLDAFARPIGLIPIAAAFLAIGYNLIDSDSAAKIPREIGLSVLILFVAWMVYDLIGAAMTILLARNASGQALIGWAVRWTRLLVILIGGLTILNIWGIQVWPILTGFGVFSIAFALGAKDMFKDMIGGFFILGEVRYEADDWIAVDDIVEGTVEAIGLRTTRIRQFDSSLRFVPNSKLADHALTNYSKLKHSRLEFDIQLDFRTTIDQLEKIRDDIRAYIIGNKDFVHPPHAAVRVHVTELGVSAITMSIYCFIRTLNLNKALSVQEELLFKIITIVADAGGKFALPTQDLLVGKQGETVSSD